MADGWWDQPWDDKSWQESASSSSWQWREDSQWRSERNEASREDSQWRSERNEASATVKAKAKSATPKLKAKSRGPSQDQREFQRWKTDHAKMLSALESERRLQDRVQELEGELWSLESTNEELVAQNRVLTQKVADLKGKSSEAEDRGKRLLADCSRLFQEKTDVQLQLDNARAVFKKECVEMRKENDEAKVLVKTAREQTDAVKRDFEKFKARVLLWTTPLYFCAVTEQVYMDGKVEQAEKKAKEAKAEKAGFSSSLSQRVQLRPYHVRKKQWPQNVLRRSG